MFALTRRQALAVGGVAAVAGGFGLWGRFALGDAFEDHVAEHLGLDRTMTRAALAQMRVELDDYDTRAAAFLVATEAPSSLVLPEGVRRAAVDAFLSRLFGLWGANVMTLVYSGDRQAVEYRPCEVLVGET